MNLLGFRYFLEVARTLNFSEASRHLHVSQPGLSQQISSLEKELGFKLLKRTTRRVTLTDEGAFLYENLKPSFNKIENTIEEIATLKKVPQAIIHISTVPSAANLWLPSLVKRMGETNADAELYLDETTSKVAIQSIKKQKSHIAFVRMSPDSNELDQENLSTYELSQHPLMAVVSKEHRFANDDILDLKQLKDEPFIHYHPKNSPELYYLLERACLQAGFVPNTICSGPEIMTIETLISHGLGVTLMPEDMVQLLRNDSVKSVRLSDQVLMSSITMIWEDTPYTPQVTREVVGIAKDEFSSIASQYL
ncbi:LOW QUALITY PROTEIN: aromatic hydrocarbon utilization transcriptional regulator CatR [Geomicrobium sp. JCM 19055]|nr:LOW QUALITY PROTEIN: aromatic hydrocarbon utilization transcriptional regulator CatR [Geomicrobium sp. JCM 19055]